MRLHDACFTPRRSAIGHATVKINWPRAILMLPILLAVRLWRRSQQRQSCVERERWQREWRRLSERTIREAKARCN